MDRPSGVSSDKEANCAISANSFSLTPAAGKNAVAIRLPIVIVPVLSKISRSISPAASTALPLSCNDITLISRSIPAIPTALKRALIVVGIKQTRRAIKIGIVSTLRKISACTTRCNLQKLSRRCVRRKMIVNAERTICRAISLGVFCLLAPSIKLIIRSKKLCPDSDVTLIFKRSLKIFVPAVTALLSPPLSRMTGADSPVIADSSTVATPSMTSPSTGMISPVSQMMISPLLRLHEGTLTSTPF